MIDLQHKLALHYAYLHDLQPQQIADLREADLCEASLRGADLHGVDLRGADLHGADLHGADLRGADLRGADLYGADLRGADLHGADLRGADLDCGVWPLWCGSLNVKLDDKLKAQLLYHVISVMDTSFFSAEQLKFANSFHQVQALACRELTHG